MENKELKEVAEKLYPIPFPDKFSNMNQEAYKEREAFISGAKWQQEQETDYLIEALKEIESVCDNQNPTHERIWRVANNVIKQFKNK